MGSPVLTTGAFVLMIVGSMFKTGALVLTSGTLVLTTGEFGLPAAGCCDVMSCASPVVVDHVVLVVDDVVESVISLLISMGAFVFTSGLFVAAGGWVLTVTGVG